MEGKAILKGLILGLVLFQTAIGKEVCLSELKNPYPDDYLDYALRRTVERAFLQAGERLRCGEGSEKVSVEVLEYKDIPTGLSSFQRVNSYNLFLSFELKTQGKSYKYSVAVPYFLPSGGQGDLPKRSALEDALGIIYNKLIENLIRR
ncbi:MAG: hypothetical protein GU346_03295 [Thermocrinis sp.]|nr:hypothetical protein [Thermocrinis sp.]